MTRSTQFWTHALQQQLLFSVGMRSNSGTRPRSFERDEQAQQNWHRLVPILLLVAALSYLTTATA